VRAIDRYRIVEAVVPFLADLSVSELNAILVSVDSTLGQYEAEWWDQNAEGERIKSLRSWLPKISDHLLESLHEFLPGTQDAFSILDSIQAAYRREEVEAAHQAIEEGSYSLEFPADGRKTALSSPESIPSDSDAMTELEAAFEKMQAVMPVEPPPVAPDIFGMAAPIFVVHGHDHAVLDKTVRVLERATGREVTVLHEQPNAGRTILEKFEDYAADTSFAVVLLTADDQGGVRTSDDMHPRGRQNVIFELGFFFGKLGRQRVAVLLDENVEKPSDVEGLVYITLDKAGAWKYALAKELEAAGISVDRSRIP
jgi:hypothetical protein